MSTRLSPEELMALTNSYHALMVEAVEATGGYVNQFVGDAVMAIFGAPVPNPDHAGGIARGSERDAGKDRCRQARRAGLRGQDRPQQRAGGSRQCRRTEAIQLYCCR